ncbi:MAG: UbiX family flavin prenyltransferase [Campylobacter sp.]|nr:UbiX family flavin prenyltransferase [Campylobacter sp.]
MKILLCVTGASLAEISLKLIDELKDRCELHVVFSKNSFMVLSAENNTIFDKNAYENVVFYNDEDIASAPASGSFRIDKTLVAPCSVNTLAKISCGIADTLITRSCAVALKEHKPLILGVREMPFSAISLEQMSKLANLGVIIAPPILGSYAGKKSDEILNFIVGKWLDLLEIKHEIYKRWS